MKKLSVHVLGKGFTLIELLIVIALLGALAIGLIGAIDPFEQLKKGTDTGVRNTVSEVQSAVIRYYALKGRMPWCAAGVVCNTFPASSTLTEMNAVAAPGSDTVGGSLQNIITTGELKSNFPTAQSGSMDKVFVTGTDADVSVCFSPVSKSFSADDNTKYQKDGTILAGSGCPTKVIGACYWCVQ